MKFNPSFNIVKFIIDGFLIFYSIYFVLFLSFAIRDIFFQLCWFNEKVTTHIKKEHCSERKRSSLVFLRSPDWDSPIWGDPFMNLGISEVEGFEN